MYEIGLLFFYQKKLEFLIYLQSQSWLSGITLYNGNWLSAVVVMISKGRKILRIVSIMAMISRYNRNPSTNGLQTMQNMKCIQILCSVIMFYLQITEIVESISKLIYTWIYFSDLISCFDWITWVSNIYLENVLPYFTSTKNKFSWLGTFL